MNFIKFLKKIRVRYFKRTHKFNLTYVSGKPIIAVDTYTKEELHLSFLSGRFISFYVDTFILDYNKEMLTIEIKSKQHKNDPIMFKAIYDSYCVDVYYYTVVMRGNVFYIPICTEKLLFYYPNGAPDIIYFNIFKTYA